MKENSIEEALKKLSTGKKIKMYELLRTFKREGIENFVITRKKYVDVILSDYKRVLKENEELKEINNELEAEKNEAIRRYNFETIPIQKVKDKIEKLEQEKKKYGNCLIKMYEDELVNRDIKILQELLESEV